MSDDRPARFVAAARALRGARWRHRGRKPWAVDCLGLLALSAKSAGFDITGYCPRIYGREPWDDSLRKGLRAAFGAPIADAPKPGDVALIRWRSGEPSHVAIIADHPFGGLTLIHSHNIEGVVEHSLAPPFDSVIVEVYRPWHATFSR